ncbi:MAG: hypothetical protein KF716_03100 [Anaerolineae bacterium]|nr:hypothetical protein [Anaerolineae bacterium]
MKWQLVRGAGCLVLLVVGLGIPALLVLITNNPSLLLVGVVTIIVGAVASRMAQRRLSIALGIEDRWKYEMSPKGLFASAMRSRENNKRMGQMLKGAVVPSRTCDVCGGSGRSHGGVCPTCGGSGKVIM